MHFDVVNSKMQECQQDDTLDYPPICVKTVTFSSLTKLAVISMVVDIRAAKQRNSLAHGLVELKLLHF